MPADRDIWRSAADFSAGRDPFVMLTVIRTEGSTPRKAGARMIWRPGAGFIGTVGGGEFERLCLNVAVRCMSERSCAVERFVLGTEAGQCCGGAVEVFCEYCGPTQRIVIFGAGHVSQALARALDAAPLEIVIADNRPEWNTEARFPNCRRVLDWGESVALAHESPEATLACVMTCSHDTDFELLRRLLVNPPAFVGLIGSKSKRVSFFRRLIALGLDEEIVNKVHCPIGLGDMGKAPELIAVSMAGQILLEAKQLASL